MYDNTKITRKFNLFFFTKFYEINTFRRKLSQGVKEVWLNILYKTQRVSCNSQYPSLLDMMIVSISMRGWGAGQAYFCDAVINHFLCLWIVIYWKTVLWILIEVHSVKHKLPKSSIVYTNIEDQFIEENKSVFLAKQPWLVFGGLI